MTNKHKILILIISIIVSFSLATNYVLFEKNINNKCLNSTSNLFDKSSNTSSSGLFLEKIATSTIITTSSGNTKQWVATDPHTHMNYCSKTLTPEDLVTNMKKNNVNVGSLLIWNKGLSDNKDRALITGKDHPASIQNHILHADVEISYVPSAHMGHLILLGLNSVGFSDKPSIYPKSSMPIVEWAAKQNPKVIVGQAHGQHALTEDFKQIGPDVPYDFPIHIARGYIDFLEMNEWYGTKEGFDMSLSKHIASKLLNSGYKFAFTGGSDFTCLSDDIGSSRAYVLIDGDLSYNAFLDGIKKGRTVVSTNNETDWVTMTINNQEVGSQINIKKGDSINIKLKGNLKEGKQFEIYSNGKLVEKVNLETGTTSKDIKLTINESSWIVALNKTILTSPIYIIADNKPIRASSKDTCYLIKYTDYMVDMIKKDKYELGEDKNLTLAAYAEARVEFVKRFQEAGGVSCH